MNRWRQALLGTIIAGAACIGITGCAPWEDKLAPYANSSPALIPEEFFTGSLVAEGLVQNRQGEVTRRFTAEIDASWRDGSGYLDERFVFDDGERQTRVWQLTPIAGKPQQYEARAGDVVGPGLLRVNGFAGRLDYVLTIQYRGRDLSLKVVDAMSLIDANTLIAESTLTKWGFRVGKILLVMRRLDQAPSPSSHANQES
jgi:hypothetical protein